MLPCTVVEASKKAQGCVIWLHGLGAYGKEFTPIVPHMMLPSVRFVFPQAVDRAVTINGGEKMPAWFDIRSLVDSPTRESQMDIVHSTHQLEALIAKQNADGIPSQNIILIGFSQGGAMALHVGLRHKSPLLGIGVLSGYMLNPMLLSSEASAENHMTPIFFGHGRRDLVVPYKKGRRAYEAAHNQQRDMSWNGYEVGHDICMTEFADIRTWFHRLFGGLGIDASL